MSCGNKDFTRGVVVVLFVPWMTILGRTNHIAQLGSLERARTGRQIVTSMLVAVLLFMKAVPKCLVRSAQVSS